MSQTSPALESNRYFDGAVQSLGFADDLGRATVGVMLPGTYTFNTDAPETMTVVSGRLTVKLAGQTTFTDYDAGSAFEVPAKSAFDLQVATPTAYLCRFH